MRIVIGADHAGFPLKEELLGLLAAATDHTIIDVGTDSTKSVDYPDYAAAVGRAVVDGRADRGCLPRTGGAMRSVDGGAEREPDP